MAAVNHTDVFRGVPQNVSSGDSSGASDGLVQKRNLTYEQMLALLQMPAYDARDEETLRQLAQSMYAPQYNAEAEAARQTQAQTDLSLRNQLAALLTNVGAQRDELSRNVLSALSQQQLSALQRGMQRSSYNQAAQSGIQSQGVKLQDQISQGLLQQQSGIEAQRQQYAQQLAETLGRLNADKAANENNLMQQMRDQDYERGMTALDMRNQLYQWLAGTYWPGAKDWAGLPEALMPMQESSGGVPTTSVDFLRQTEELNLNRVDGHWNNDAYYSHEPALVVPSSSSRSSSLKSNSGTTTTSSDPDQDLINAINNRGSIATTYTNDPLVRNGVLTIPASLANQLDWRNYTSQKSTPYTNSKYECDVAPDLFPHRVVALRSA